MFGFGFVFGLVVGLGVELVAGLVAGLMFGLVVVLAAGLTELIEAGIRPADPRETWRNDPRAGLMFGLMAGLVVGLAGGLGGGLMFGLMFGPMVGLACVLAFGLAISQKWSTTLVWLQLRRSGHVAAVRLMPFLEDARERDVLRTAGAVYQFRHATLQDHLVRLRLGPPSLWVR